MEFEDNLIIVDFTRTERDLWIALERTIRSKPQPADEIQMFRRKLVDFYNIVATFVNTKRICESLAKKLFRKELNGIMNDIDFLNNLKDEKHYELKLLYERWKNKKSQ